jgi:NAD-dependent deacetylase
MLINDLRQSQNIVLITGAGISIASGIQPFRKDKDAVWEQNIMEKGTRSYFNNHPVQAWQWYLQRFGKLKDTQPNAAHVSLAQLESWAQDHHKDFTIITQNIDHLHKKVGSQQVIEIHGKSNAVRCSNPPCNYAEPRGSIPMAEVNQQFEIFKSTQTLENLPRCSACGSIVRAHILWFDEYYSSHEDFEWQKAQDQAMKADLMIFIGTSFAVGITELMSLIGRDLKIPMYVIDPSPEYEEGFKYIEEKSEVYLPQLVAQL